MEIHLYDPKSKKSGTFDTDCLDNDRKDILQKFMEHANFCAEVMEINGLRRMKVPSPTRKGEYLFLLLKGNQYAISQPENVDEMEKSLDFQAN